MPKGGVARRATIVKQERAKGANVLALDAGDTLFGTGIRDSGDSAILLEAMNLMGYDAMTLGEVDLTKGITAAADLAAKAKFPLLAANLEMASGTRPFWKPYVVLEVGGHKVGVLGLVGDTLFNQASMGDGFDGRMTVSDAIQSARRWISQIQKETRVIVVLSHLGLDGDRRLAKEVNGISAIVGGHTRVVTNSPEVVGPNATVVVQAGYNGEYVGVLRLEVDGNGRVLASSETIVTLTPEVADDPAMMAFVDGRRYKPADS